MNAHRHSPGFQKGLSLIELMISMAIGLFLLAGAVSVLGKGRDLYRTNDAAARLQETARYAMSTIEADLRMANYWGLNSRADLVENGPTLSLINPPAVDPTYTLPATLAGFAGTINSCGAMWAVKLPAYVEGNNNAYGLGCPAFGTEMAGSDQLTVRRASTQIICTTAGVPVGCTGILTATNRQIKVQTSRSLGSLFGNTVLPAGYAPPLSETRAVVVNGYYVSQGSDQDAATPSLRRKQLPTNALQPIVDSEIVPGVEDLQVEFGVDQNDDQNADFYVAPGTAIPAGQLIVAVRVWLMVRGEDPEFSLNDNRSFAYADRAAFTPADNFRRVLVTKTIALRNTRR